MMRQAMKAGMWGAMAFLLVESVHAERLPEAPSLGPTLSLGHRLKTNISEMSRSMGVELSKLTLGMVDMRFDLHAKTAQLGLGGGDPEAFRLHLDSDVVFVGDTARVKAKLDLAIAGRDFNLDLPEFAMKTETVAGQRAVQVSLPVLLQRF